MTRSGWVDEYRAYFPGYPPVAAADFLLARLAAGAELEALTESDQELIECFAILAWKCLDAISSYQAYQAGLPLFSPRRIVGEADAPGLVAGARELLQRYRTHPDFDPSWLD